jgi:hypothetical protein
VILATRTFDAENASMNSDKHCERAPSTTSMAGGDAADLTPKLDAAAAR